VTIAVGLSGGVDSAVALALLKEQGHTVHGITMKIWPEGDHYKGGKADACFGPHERDDIRTAAALCEQLSVPYHVFDCSNAYEKIVVDYFRKEYLSGRTPNPCIRCNSLMKFGVLLSMARQSGVVFDYFATGHYARITHENDRWCLHKGADLFKDQSYFLYRLSQHQLESVLFPLGTLTKHEVRAYAQRLKLGVAQKKDSQDFYSGDYRELLHVEETPGPIVDRNGNTLGTHTGHWNFTIGQRKGLHLSGLKTPRYVVAINACRNEVVVDENEATLNHYVRLAACNWVSKTPEKHTQLVDVKLRSAARPTRAELTLSQDMQTVDLNFPTGTRAATLGQSAVLYEGDLLIGGGVIEAIA
jgi:tRNA-specific 2-thiouridylase